MIPFAFFHDFIRPEGTLNFSDVCLPEEEHTNTGLTDTSPDGKRNYIGFRLALSKTKKVGHLDINEM